MSDLHTAELGEAIRRGRCALGIGINEAARRAGVGPNTISRLEAGSIRDHPRRLTEISVALGFEAPYLMDVLRGNRLPHPCPIHQRDGCPPVVAKPGRPRASEPVTEGQART